MRHDSSLNYRKNMRHDSHPLNSKILIYSKKKNVKRDVIVSDDCIIRQSTNKDAIIWNWCRENFNTTPSAKAWEVDVPLRITFQF